MSFGSRLSRLRRVEDRRIIKDVLPLQEYTYRDGETEEQALARHGLPECDEDGYQILYVGHHEDWHK